MGAYGNKLREKNLISRGYQYQKKILNLLLLRILKWPLFSIFPNTKNKIGFLK